LSEIETMIGCSKPIEARSMQEEIESVPLKSVSHMFKKRTRPPDTGRVAAGPILGVIEDLCGDRSNGIAPPYSRFPCPPAVE
jgi:hypothetical protein